MEEEEATINKQGKLEQFILDNNLQFDGEGSDLNSDCCIISGYALHIGADENDIEQAIDNVREDAVGNYEEELERVFDFAKASNYGSWWKRTEAKEKYKF